MNRAATEIIDRVRRALLAGVEPTPEDAAFLRENAPPGMVAACERILEEEDAVKLMTAPKSGRVVDGQMIVVVQPDEPVSPAIREALEESLELAHENAASAHSRRKGSDKTNAAKRTTVEKQREAARRSVDKGTSYADEAEGLGVGRHEPKRISLYIKVYRSARSEGMSRDEARAEADSKTYS